MHTARFELEASPEACAAAAGALALELSDVQGQARAWAESGRLLLEAEAPDLAALRASMHTLLRLADAALRTSGLAHGRGEAI